MPDLSEFSRRWRSVGHAWPMVAAACLGLAVAVSAWFAVSIWEERLARAKFNAVAGDYASILQNGLDDFLGGIYALRAFYNSSHQVDRNEFALFTSQFNRNQSDIMRLIWCPRVTREQRAAFERARENGFPDFAIMAWSLSNSDVRFRPSATSISRALFDRCLQTSATLGVDLSLRSLSATTPSSGLATAIS